MQVNKEDRYSVCRKIGSFLLMGCLLFLFGFSIKHIPVRTTYVDSTIYHIDTVFVRVPKETVIDYVDWLDTLKMQSSLVDVQTYLDTSNRLLKGKLTHKDTTLAKEVLWKERIVYQDSISVKEIPKEIPVTPKWSWYSLVGNFVLLILAGLLIKRKWSWWK